MHLSLRELYFWNLPRQPVSGGTAARDGLSWGQWSWANGRKPTIWVCLTHPLPCLQVPSGPSRGPPSREAPCARPVASPEGPRWALTKLTLPRAAIRPRLFTPFLSRFSLRSSQWLFHSVPYLLTGSLVASETGPEASGVKAPCREGSLGLRAQMPAGSVQVSSCCLRGAGRLLPCTPQVFPCVNLSLQLLIQ